MILLRVGHPCPVIILFSILDSLYPMNLSSPASVSSTPRFWNGGALCGKRAGSYHHIRKPRRTILYSRSISAVVVQGVGHSESGLNRIGSLTQVSGVLGCQWGDEGKGKLVDILAKHFDIVARCQVKLSAYLFFELHWIISCLGSTSLIQSS